MSRAKILALKIAQILEEYSEEEISNAVLLLSARADGEALLDYLLNQKGSRKPAPAKRESRPKATKPIEKTTSRAVLNARDSDPEKFEILREFDTLVRAGRILKTNEALTRFGERLSKNFTPRKSKRESISAVMEVLSEYPLSEMRESIGIVLAETEQNGNGYQNLANFLIKGKPAD